MKQLMLRLYQEKFAISRLSPDAQIPAWALTEPFFSISRTDDELSILCQQDAVPSGIQSEMDWRCFKMAGPFDFSLTGILASTLNPLAKAEIGILAISSFDTDFVLVKEVNLERAIEALQAAGHWVSQC